MYFFYVPLHFAGIMFRKYTIALVWNFTSAVFFVILFSFLFKWCYCFLQVAVRESL